jgi:SWI/SNF-related matrix-associated actin-dependent regulator of chromatin subfamily A3
MGENIKNIIDLLESDDDDDEVLWMDRKPIFDVTNKRPSPTDVKKVAGINYGRPEIKRTLFEKKLGSFVSNIVGSHLYPDMQPGNTLSLSPDTSNSYDRNAIQLQLGVSKRGHLPREHASIVSPLLQEGSISMHAKVFDVKNRKKVQIEVQIHAKSYHVLTPEETQTRIDAIDGQLSKLNWIHGEASLASVLKELDQSTQKAMVKLVTEVRNGTAEHQSPVDSFINMPDKELIPASIDISNMDSEQTIEVLDRMFDEIQAEQLANLPSIPMPKHLAKMELYDYQKDGIKWLVNQERKDTVPFFEKVGKSTWKCVITEARLNVPPSPIRGSILADDMGLGKTIQTLGLILCNPPPGQKGYPYKKTSSLSAKSVPPRTTLIVAPVSVMAQWMIQIKKYVNRPSKEVLVTTRYYGTNRDMCVNLVLFNQCDVMITSYNTLASDFRTVQEEIQSQELSNKKRHQKPKRTIFDVQFHRIVLDEAHIIRNASSGFFKAVQMLQSRNKLCLTGTPFVNKPADIHSLLAFLNVPPLSQKAVFDRAVTVRIKNRDERGLSTLRTTMANLALRRSKEQVHSTIKLPNKKIFIEKLTFSEGIHKQVHDMLYDSARAIFLGMLRRGIEGEKEIMRNFMQFLVLILRVRQACNSAGLVPPEYVDNARSVVEYVAENGSKDLDSEDALDLLEKLTGVLEKDTEELEECTICMEELDSESTVILRTCKHIFCQPCLQKIRPQLCPVCRCDYNEDDMVTKRVAQAVAKEDSTKAEKDAKAACKLNRPPKIAALFEKIEEMQDDEKGVIFSQWTSMLDGKCFCHILYSKMPHACFTECV